MKSKQQHQPWTDGIQFLREAELRMVIRDATPVKDTYIAKNWEPFRLFISRLAFCADTADEAKSAIARAEGRPQ